MPSTTHRGSEKLPRFCHNVIKCWPIFKIFSLALSEICDKEFIEDLTMVMTPVPSLGGTERLRRPWPLRPLCFVLGHYTSLWRIIIVLTLVHTGNLPTKCRRVAVDFFWRDKKSTVTLSSGTLTICRRQRRKFVARNCRQCGRAIWPEIVDLFRKRSYLADLRYKEKWMRDQLLGSRCARSMD